ncbi:hypothetical protein SAMN05216357_113114 [Porphyromonadaceae bacterium KH3CP3RA]|nr:hypothetical protein SAMN05216357_113114 [Porphyromonadaceae bacterium KH3CP3RA]
MSEPRVKNQDYKIQDLRFKIFKLLDFADFSTSNFSISLIGTLVH